MTTLTANQILASYADLGQRPSGPRLGALRALFARMATAARADAARRSAASLPEHLLRDIGLTRADFDL